MAREGKGDIVDYGKKIKEKKGLEKPTIPSFNEVSDNEIINERQEITEQNTEPDNEIIIEVVQNHENNNDSEPKKEPEHVHDKFTEQFLEQFNKKITKEDTHTRQTWLIKNETIQRLERLSEGKKKGFKTELVNQALELFLDRIEK